MNLLEYLNARSISKITKSDVQKTMIHGTTKEKEDLWKQINELGGYDALED